jgi:hypothetical protein
MKRNENANRNAVAAGFAHVAALAKTICISDRARVPDDGCEDGQDAPRKSDGRCAAKSIKLFQASRICPGFTGFG